MDTFSADWWKQQLAALMNSPILCLPPAAIVAAVVWWFRGTMFQPVIAGLKGEIAGLREQINVFGAQKTMFDAQMQIAAREMALERSRQDSFARKISDLKEDATKAENDFIVTRVARLEAGFSELVAASTAAHSAIEIAIGASLSTASSMRVQLEAINQLGKSQDDNARATASTHAKLVCEKQKRTHCGLQIFYHAR